MNHLNNCDVPYIGPGGACGSGLGGPVRVGIEKRNIPGSLRRFGWDSAASTCFRADARERLAVLLFRQHMPFDVPSVELFPTLACQDFVN